MLNSFKLAIRPVFPRYALHATRAATTTTTSSAHGRSFLICSAHFGRDSTGICIPLWWVRSRASLSSVLATGTSAGSPMHSRIRCGVVHSWPYPHRVERLLRRGQKPRLEKLICRYMLQLGQPMLDVVPIYVVI